MSDHDLRNCLANYLAVKRKACERGPRTATIVLHLRYADGEWALHPIFDRTAIAATIEAAAAERDVPLAWVALLADAHRKRIHLPEGAPAPLNSAARAAFEAGDMTVEDVLSATLVEADGTVRCATCAYRYDDRGQPKFGPVVIEDVDPEGYVVDTLKEAMT